MPVINKYHHDGKVPKGAINIMRGTIYGNPFPITKTKNREQVIAEYRAYLEDKIKTDVFWKIMVKNLHGKTLCCCCSPAPCHGDVLLEMAAVLAAEPVETITVSSKPESLRDFVKLFNDKKDNNND